MKCFLEMIEHVKSSGTIEDYASNRPEDEVLKLFFALVEQCQPFVLLPKHPTPTEIVSEEETFDPNAPIINAPFRVYSIEMLGDFVHISVAREEDRIKVSCSCLLAYEIEPMKFLTFAYTEYVHPITHTNGRMVMLTTAFNYILKELTNRITTEDLGYCDTNKKVKIGTGKSKRFHKFKQIIYVKPKKTKLSSELGPEAKGVCWAHRWSVRGHWRKHLGLGKDRQGVYCVQDHTWVTEHVKGPEEALLITKVRLVD